MSENLSSKAKDMWGNFKLKINDAKTISMEDVKDYTSDKINLAKKMMSKKNVEKLGQSIKDAALEATSPGKIAKYRSLLNKATENTWEYIKDTPEVAVEKYNKMDKGYKILAISAMAGGAIVSIPFIMAVGPISIVSALASVGLGALSAGGFGVAGGIIVTGGGAALAAAIAGTVASKLIDDPEVNELIENYTKLEEIIKQNFATMDYNQAKYKQLYEKYAGAANYVAELQNQIQNGDQYDIDEVRNINNRLKFTIEDLEENLESESV